VPDVMKTVGRYEILREVGRGGMAMVYLARQTDLDRFVALKELGAFHASDESFAQRFLRESRVAGSLSHPNVVTVHDYFQHDGTPYIAMEYVERGSLRPYVGKMNLAQMGGVLEGLLAGLAHAEQHGIVHRDLKPENLMVTSDGRVKIADFGIAKASTKMQTGAFLTATGTTVGTPTYMAPEQAMAQDIGPWTDLYSVGCMAFELFTGRVPFHDSDAPMAILLRHVNEPIAPVKSIDPSVDERISDWIEGMLVKDPEKRTQSASDAWEDFEEIIISLLGPRWRREARLMEHVEQVDTPKPLTPAPFEGTSTDGAVSDEFQSFAWGNAVSPDTAGAPAAPVPGPYTPPPADAAPLPDVAPITPPSSEALPEPAAEDPGFLTFGAPAPAPPTDALVPPPRPPTEEPPLEPVEEAPPAPVEEPPPAPVQVAPPAPVEASPPPPVEEAPPPAREPEPVAATVMPDAISDRPPDTFAAPVVRPAPAEPRTEEPATRRSLFPVLLVVGALVAIAAGFFAGGSGGGTPAATGSALSLVAASPDVKAKVPAGWTKSASAAEVPGLTLSDAVAFGPGGKVDGDTILLGAVRDSANNSTLLSTDFIKAVGKVPPKEAVQIGDLQAYRYRDVDVPGFARRVTLYAVPTSAGVATIACLSPPAGAAAFRPTCDGSANTLALVSAKPFPVGPNADYAKRVSGTLAALASATKSAQSRLSSAKTPKAQASATRSLAAAHAKAAQTLAALKVSPADAFANAQLARALRSANAAYGKAAKAAAKKDKRGFGRANVSVKTAQQDIATALDGLKSAGYNLRQ
jgi:hypothetical protein